MRNDGSPAPGRTQGVYDAGRASPNRSLILLSYGHRSSSPAGTEWGAGVIAPVKACAESHDSGVIVDGGMDIEDWSGSPDTAPA